MHANKTKYGMQLCLVLCSFFIDAAASERFTAQSGTTINYYSEMKNDVTFVRKATLTGSSISEVNDITIQYENANFSMQQNDKEIVLEGNNATKKGIIHITHPTFDPLSAAYKVYIKGNNVFSYLRFLKNNGIVYLEHGSTLSSDIAGATIYYTEQKQQIPIGAAHSTPTDYKKWIFNRWCIGGMCVVSLLLIRYLSLQINRNHK